MGCADRNAYGITPATTTHFDRFLRSDPSLPRQAATGLGLQIGRPLWPPHGHILWRSTVFRKCLLVKPRIARAQE